MIDTSSATLLKMKELLLGKRHKIELEAQEKIAKIDRQIEYINGAAEIIRNALADYICPNCAGSGIVKRCDAAGQMETETCDSCHGTGIVQRNKEDIS